MDQMNIQPPRRLIFYNHKRNVRSLFLGVPYQKGTRHEPLKSKFSGFAIGWKRTLQVVFCYHRP